MRLQFIVAPGVHPVQHIRTHKIPAGHLHLQTVQIPDGIRHGVNTDKGRHIHRHITLNLRVDGDLLIHKQTRNPDNTQDQKNRHRILGNGQRSFFQERIVPHRQRGPVPGLWRLYRTRLVIGQDCRKRNNENRRNITADKTQNSNRTKLPYVGKSGHLHCHKP